MSPALMPLTTSPSRRATSRQFVHNFEELPLFWSHHDKIAWRAGLIDGQFEVSYDETGDWFISEISIAADNGKLGTEAKGKLLTLDCEDRLYLLILDAIDLRYASFIDEYIADELAESIAA